MNMPKYMQLRADSLGGNGQFLTAKVFAGRSNLVQSPERWAMRDEDVRFQGDHVPVLANGWAAINIECPVEKAGLLG